MSLLAFTFLFFNGFYKFPFRREKEKTFKKDFSVISYNVRGLNRFEQLPKEGVDSLIYDFLLDQDADIICLQEGNYLLDRGTPLDDDYPHRYVDFVYINNKTKRVVQTIFSKFPITQVIPIEFPRSSNSALCVDLEYEGNSIRVLNAHLQSFRILPDFESVTNKDSKKLFNRVQETLSMQGQQASILKKVVDSTSIPTIILGDFNNTRFSNVYNKITDGFNDTFLEAGSGFGSTYKLLGMPMRIDYILVDDDFEVLSHTNFDVKLSDHYPVMATLRLKSNK